MSSLTSPNLIGTSNSNDRFTHSVELIVDIPITSAIQTETSIFMKTGSQFLHYKKMGGIDVYNFSNFFDVDNFSLNHFDGQGDNLFLQVTNNSNWRPVQILSITFSGINISVVEFEVGKNWGVHSFSIYDNILITGQWEDGYQIDVIINDTIRRVGWASPSWHATGSFTVGGYVYLAGDTGHSIIHIDPVTYNRSTLWTYGPRASPPRVLGTPVFDGTKFAILYQPSKYVGIEAHLTLLPLVQGSFSDEEAINWYFSESQSYDHLALMGDLVLLANNEMVDVFYVNSDLSALPAYIGTVQIDSSISQITSMMSDFDNQVIYVGTDKGLYRMTVNYRSLDIDLQNSTHLNDSTDPQNSSTPPIDLSGTADANNEFWLFPLTIVSGQIFSRSRKRRLRWVDHN